MVKDRLDSRRVCRLRIAEYAGWVGFLPCVVVLLSGCPGGGGEAGDVNGGGEDVSDEIDGDGNDGGADVGEGEAFVLVCER